MNAHADLLKRLMPTSYDPAGRVLNALLAAEGAALDVAAANSGVLLVEDDPRSAMQTIPDWERVLGASVNRSTAARRAFLVGKLNESGGQSRDYFVALAASLGYRVTLDEFRPATVLDSVMTPLTGVIWRFVWRVNVAAASGYRQASVLDTVMDAFASWGNADFEAAMREDAPAHTLVLFAYQ